MTMLEWVPATISPIPDEPVLIRFKDEHGWDYDVAVNIDGEWWQKNMHYRIERPVEDYAVLSCE